jgi:hypothetical protein
MSDRGDAMIRVSEAEEYFKKKVNASEASTKSVWEAFKSFGREPVEDDDGVALLFQCGVSDIFGEKLFYFDFVRQFAISECEEFYRLEQLHCQFAFNPTEELNKLRAAEWYFNYEGEVDDYYSKIESLEEFKIPMDKEPLRFKIFQEKI